MGSMRLPLTFLFVITELIAVTPGAHVAQEKPRSHSHENDARPEPGRLLRTEGAGRRHVAVGSDGATEKEQASRHATHSEDADVYVEVDGKGRGGDSEVGRSRDFTRTETHARGLSSRKLMAHAATRKEPNATNGTKANGTKANGTKANSKTTTTKPDAENEEESTDDDDPVQDCAYNDWQKWSECTETCGGGSRHRTRTVKTEAANGGQECKQDEKKQTEDCHTQECPVDCVISDWQEWGKCAPDCSGKRARSRTLIQQATHGGEACGETNEEESCDGVCTDCEYQDWGAWAECSATCGGGTRPRAREVAVPATNGGKVCQGAAKETEDCGETPCPVDCEANDWSDWSHCVPFCAGNRTRERTVKTKAQNGGKDCGDLEDFKACSNYCLDCQWEDWSDWTTCSATCAGGKFNRTRSSAFLPHKAEAAAGGSTAKAGLLELPEEKSGFEIAMGKKCSRKAIYAKPWAEVVAICTGTGKNADNCHGIYDPGCDKGQVFICRKSFVLEPEEDSCTYTKKDIGRNGTECSGEPTESKECNTEVCPVDCVYSDWGTWSPCAPYCAGTQTRSRAVVKPAVGAGEACVDEALKETQNCSNVCVDCVWGNWSEWETCPVTCGGGKQKHNRSVAVAQQGKGKNCTGPAEEEQSCNQGSCPVDCAMSDWTAWTTCEPFCSGFKKRSRMVTQPPLHGGQVCGNLTEDKACGNFCMDCQVSDWTTWTSCTKSCAGGISNRTRTEVYVQRPNASGASLLEMTALGYEKKLGFRCTTVSMLPAAAGLSPAAGEALCSEDPECLALYDEGCHGVVTVCKGGTLEEEQGSCTYTKKEIGQGRPCDGNISQAQKCNKQECPVDCVVSDWGTWTVCEPFCEGQQSRNRTVKVEAAFGGVACPALNEAQSCNNTCLDCLWSDWAEWSVCTASCEGGKQGRARSVARAKVGVAADCEGPEEQSQKCNEMSCPVDCELTDWTGWSSCHPYCIGTQNRSRTVKISNDFGGAPCGNLADEKSCTNFCMDCQLSEWTEWSDCTKTCASGSSSREREEVYVQRKPKPSFLQLQEGAASSTGAWGYQKKLGFRCDEDHQRSLDGASPQDAEALCSADPTCGGLYDKGCDNWVTICNKNFIMEAEEGSCIYQKQEIGQGEPCEGYISETMKCNEEKCPVDCVMSEWTDWTVCEPFCEGSHTKTREITTQPAFGGAPCGLTKKEETCSNFCVDCEWSDWSEWEACTVSCAGGKTQRNRTIAVPKQGGGKECVGVTQETASCKEQECPIDCEFSGWSLWSPCEPYCEGTQQRNRNITVEPAFGGVTCLAAAKAMSEGLQGVTRQTRECSNLCRDCDWLDWTPFGSCSVSCGGGNKQRFRDQLFVKRSSGAPGEEPAFAPAPVYGFELKMNFRCAENSRREGILSMAAAREVCSTDPNCGGVYDEGCDGSAVICEVGFGLHDEEGSCIHNKLEIGGGSECEVQETKQTEQCGTGECPIDCMYSDWTTWTLCEPHCNGTQTRGREILRLAEHGGEACQGTAESQTCSNFCVHCRWAEWSAWSTCSVSCAGGSQTRTRTEAVPKAGGGEACEGKGAEVRVCGDLNCPVDCVVSDWTAWSPCKPYCHGLQNRSRATVTPARFGGAPCGELAEERACANLCLDCQLSGWDEWAACSSSCGGGSRHRLRSETYVARNRSNTSGASLLEVSSQAIGYEKKMGVRCDEAHQRKLHVAAPGAAQEACSSDPSCGGVYDHGCQNFWAICDVGYVLESEEGSCSYMKKEIGQGEACEGNVAQDEDCNDQLCPVDCVYTEWTAWSPCEPYCSGMSNRTRNITKEPLNGGEPCNRVAEVSNCSNTCVDCEWHSWTAWSDCTASCDGGSRLRVRSVAVQQDGGGLKCSGNDTQVEDCNDKIACPVDCQITDWSGWTPCTPFCSGKQQRSRSIIAQPFAGGAACGETGEEVNCTNACVDCVVSAWTDWSECSATCSGGSQHRSRGVVTHAQGQGLPCPEKLQQTKEDMCAPMDCPVDCQWGDWTPWNGCTATCGEGTQDRTRDEVVSAAFGGLPCEGSSREWKACVMEICPMDCQWGEWSAWGNCSTSCDSGFQRRNRSVAFPKVGEGADCDGHDEDAQPCSQRGCPRDCILHDWQDWSECSATCGPGGKRKRIRDAESEIEGGRPCNESNEEFEACGLEGCPRNCIWGDWGGWSNCTKSCGKGIAFRERVQIVTAAFGGSCDGSAVQTDFCNKVPCPEDCIWNDWGRWSSCSEACGSSVAGTKTRLRTKSGPYNAGEDCIGFPTETAPCNAPGGCSVNCSWEVWSPWTACSRSCSTGTRSRHRSVDTEAYGPLGRNCTGEPLQEEACDTHTHCPIDCEFEDWADWGSCQLQPCGSAKRLRSREKGVAQFGGAPCMGNTSEVEDCEVPGAPPVVPCNASVPFGNVPEAVTKPPAGSAEANPPPGPWEAAEQAAKAAKEQGLSAEEQVAAAGAAAAAALGGSATVAAEAAMAAAKVSGAAPNRQVELAAEAAAAAAARASGGNASHAAQEAANAASVVAKQANLTAAEEASIAATAARESASESGASVESVATAAAQVAKEEGATPQEAAAAAAVAAADAAKKQGANPAQSAEVAVAAAKAAGTSQQEQSAAAAMAYTRAGGTGTLNLTKLGLGPVARRVNVTEEQAEEIAEKEPESVQGSESLQVSDPETFMHDTAALEAARDALGAQLGVDPDAIVIVDAQPVAATANSASMLEMARKVSSMARRQAPSSGEVNISYKVVPSVSGKTNEEVVNAVQHLDSAEASKKVEQVFAEKKLSYQVSVASMELSVTNKEKGVTKEEATLTEKRSGASRSSMATLIAMLGSLSLM